MARSSVFKHDFNIPLPPHFKGRRVLDKTKLMMIPRDHAARAAHLALYQLQDETPEEIVAGAALMFTVVCAKCNVDPASMVEMARRILSAPDEGDHVTGNSLQVLKDFISGRVMARDVSLG